MFYPPPEIQKSPIEVQPGFCCSVAQSCLTPCDPMNFSMPGFPVHHHLLKLAQTHSTGLPMPSNNLILCHAFCSCLQYSPVSRGFSQWVDSSHQEAKVFHNFSSKEWASFNFTESVTIYSYFGAQVNKVWLYCNWDCICSISLLSSSFEISMFLPGHSLPLKGTTSLTSSTRDSFFFVSNFK